MNSAQNSQKRTSNQGFKRKADKFFHLTFIISLHHFQRSTLLRLQWIDAPCNLYKQI